MWLGHQKYHLFYSHFLGVINSLLLTPYSLITLSGSRINLRHVSLELIKNFLDDKEIGNKGMRET